MGKNLYKLIKRFDDVIIILMCHDRLVLRVFAEYLKNGLTDFYQTYVIF